MTLAVIGCGIPQQGPRPSRIIGANTWTLRDTVAIESSPFEPQIRVLGPEYRYGGRQDVQFLRSWVPKNGADPIHQLYVTTRYTGSWKFWNRANDEHAERMEFSEISRDVGDCSYGCSYWETFGVSIPHHILEREGDGYAVKFYSQRGHEMVITLSASQLRTQLDAVDLIRAQRIGAKPDSPPAR